MHHNATLCKKLAVIIKFVENYEKSSQICVYYFIDDVYRKSNTTLSYSIFVLFVNFRCDSLNIQKKN